MSVFDKLNDLKDALVGDHQQSGSGHSGEQGQKGQEHWTDKIKDALDGDEEARAARKKREEEEERKRIEKEHEDARKNVEANRSIAGKLHDALDGGKHKAELEEAEFQRLDALAKAERKQHEDLGDKIRNVLDDPSTLKGELMGAALSHSDTSSAKVGRTGEEQKKRDEGWREKLRELAGQEKPQEKKEVERDWLKEKINEMAGGGAKSEAREDRLDKTIDLIQQHILKQGDQSNESALEQMKDEQIRKVIITAYQQTTGHDFPLKDKRDEKHEKQ